MVLIDFRSCRFKKAGLMFREELVLYFVIEVICILENIHATGFIHADIKPDNFLVTDVPKINYNATTAEQMFEGCPSSLQLIDFGRAIDMKILPQGTTFNHKVRMALIV